MEIHRQTCQNCGSRKLRNIIVRSSGENEKIFVQCRGCERLVARYILADFGYYHHGKDFESYLRSLNRGSYIMSGKNLHRDFWKIKEVCLTEFGEILQILEERRGSGREHGTESTAECEN